MDYGKVSVTIAEPRTYESDVLFRSKKYPDVVVIWHPEKQGALMVFETTRRDRDYIPSDSLARVLEEYICYLHQEGKD